MEISAESLELAYRKLKHYIYYDNVDLYLRAKLADFEVKNIDRMEGMFEDLAKVLKKPNSKKWRDLLSRITYIPRVKKISQPTKPSAPLISNSPATKDIDVSSLAYHIDAPIEIHLLSTLWCMTAGYILQGKMEIKPYGSKLSVDKDGEPVDGLRLFSPYFKEYASWRDQATQKAKAIVDEGKHALIFCLDVKSCYDSIDFDYDEIKEHLEKDVEVQLTDLIKKVCQHYSTKVHPDLPHENSCLPIGLSSSGVLANWHLRHFDNEVAGRVNPDYYGRYVDDIFVVCSSSRKFHNPNHENLISKIFTKTKLLTLVSDEEKSEGVKKDVNEYFLLPECEHSFKGYNKTLKIQSEKLLVYHFDKTQPTSLLDSFEAAIRRNSSEFRFLPEESEFREDFDEICHSLNYSDTPNKMRSVTESQDDKFSIAKFLGKKLTLLSCSEIEDDSDTREQVLRFFKGWKAISYTGLWERVFTYFLLSKDLTRSKRLYSQIEGAIKNTSTDQLTKELQESLRDYLCYTTSMAWALNPRFGMKLKERNPFNDPMLNFRKSQLVRHRFVACTLLNMTEIAYENEALDLTTHANLADDEIKLYEINIDHNVFMPRYIHFHEVTLYIIHKNALNHKLSEDDQLFDIYYYLDEAFTLYCQLNRKSDLSKEKLFQVDWSKAGTPVKVKVQEDSTLSKLKVALANLQVSDKTHTRDYIKHPTPTPEWRRQLTRVFKESKSAKADMLILPEISVPRHWLPWVADHFCRRHQQALTFGLEHWKIGNVVYNLIVTLLPVEIDNHHEVIIIARLKNHYAPEERRIIEGYGFDCPKAKSDYHLINWKNIAFTVFNCFELTSIEDRAQFQSKIDLLIASEYNHDLNYFSSIVESTARDLHCFVAQSNTTQLGDSRVTQPAKTERKDLLRFKGGENPTALVTTLAIDKLRQFQVLKYELQKDDGHFKPTPPGFDSKAVDKRISASMRVKKKK